MKMDSRMMLAVALLFAMVAASDGLRCYKCMASERKCGDPFNVNSGVVKSNCLENQKFCRKTKLTVDGQSTVSRSCATDCQQGSRDGTEISCCNSELCNSASSLAASSILITAAFISIYRALN